MTPRVRTLLDQAGVPYQVVRHAPAYTAQQRAATAHIPGRHVAKVVMVRDGEWFGMAVLPAPAQLYVEALARASRRERVRLAAENEFAHLFPDSEPGAIPAFGRLYGLDVFLDQALAVAGEIVCPSGSHGEEIQMAVGDYIRVAQPTVAGISTLSRAA
ncbi:MAG: YbaK/EbsC family protein [Firmicutes bacterium]|nr:YbaK/EbsC family protein [Bacillota bacterium]